MESEVVEKCEVAFAYRGVSQGNVDILTCELREVYAIELPVVVVEERNLLLRSYHREVAGVGVARCAYENSHLALRGGKYALIGFPVAGPEFELGARGGFQLAGDDPVVGAAAACRSGGHEGVVARYGVHHAIHTVFVGVVLEAERALGVVGRIVHPSG